FHQADGVGLFVCHDITSFFIFKPRPRGTFPGGLLVRGERKESGTMSRAFTKDDDDAALMRERDDELRRLREWLAIQEKKRRFLEEDPKGQAIDEAQRVAWLESVRADIAKTLKQLEDLEKSEE
ncbi:MAG TPA: hypothetical protein PL162_09135, partial [Synergistaceae bacterium]|nr:hypothetical protein [Synergistaceae bacterium]